MSVEFRQRIGGRIYKDGETAEMADSFADARR